MNLQSSFTVHEGELLRGSSQEGCWIRMAIDLLGDEEEWGEGRGERC